MAKTKALISFAVTAKLICVFVFAYMQKSRFSHDEAHIEKLEIGLILSPCMRCDQQFADTWNGYTINQRC